MHRTLMDMVIHFHNLYPLLILFPILYVYSKHGFSPLTSTLKGFVLRPTRSEWSTLRCFVRYTYIIVYHIYHLLYPVLIKMSRLNTVDRRFCLYPFIHLNQTSLQAYIDSNKIVMIICGDLDSHHTLCDSDQIMIKKNLNC